MGLASRLNQLDAMRRRWTDLAEAAGAAVLPGETHRVPGRLTEIHAFGPNPGLLKMHVFVPARLAPRPALVVLLHGCTQDAAGFDSGTGWSHLAERHGFVVVAPEQTRVNNPKCCFNWFLPTDIAAQGGEAQSIRAMVEHAIGLWNVDRDRIFATGLSAGGAMTAVLLATAPDLFAAGAIVAGLPYGVALNAGQALDQMFKPQPRPAAALADLVRAASPGTRDWPRVSIWQGDADPTVKPANAEELVKQWTSLHGCLDRRPDREKIGRHDRYVWRGPDGRALVETILVAGLAHGAPLATQGDDACGKAGPYLIETGLSSTRRIADFFGLTG